MYAQSWRAGVRSRGNLASSAPISSSESPIRCAKTMKAMRHQPGESHFDLMKSFANDDRLARIGAATEVRGYRSHEFGDSLLIERGEEAA